jgi:hypothetical protein
MKAFIEAIKKLFAQFLQRRPARGFALFSLSGNAFLVLTPDGNSIVVNSEAAAHLASKLSLALREGREARA